MCGIRRSGRRDGCRCDHKNRDVGTGIRRPGLLRARRRAAPDRRSRATRRHTPRSNRPMQGTPGDRYRSADIAPASFCAADPSDAVRPVRALCASVGVILIAANGDDVAVNWWNWRPTVDLLVRQSIVTRQEGEHLCTNGVGARLGAADLTPCSPPTSCRASSIRCLTTDDCGAMAPSLAIPPSGMTCRWTTVGTARSAHG